MGVSFGLVSGSGRGKRYLVTGGAGFIGSNLAHALLERGQEVRVFDDFSTGHAENLQDINGDIEMLEGDVRDIEAVTAAVRNVDVVLHEAALSSVPRSLRDPVGSHSVNATGTLNVLMAAREAEVGRVVYAGSSSAYGDADRLPVEETMPVRPMSPYAVSKIAGEQYLRAFHLGYGMSTVTLRYFNVFGPRQDQASEYAAVVPRFVKAALESRPATIYGDGKQARDFTYVADVVAANLLAAEAPEASGRVFNIACSDPRSVLELWECVQANFSSDPVEPEFAKSRTGDVKNSHADISAARAVLGFSPSITFEEGIARTVEWLNKT